MNNHWQSIHLGNVLTERREKPSEEEIATESVRIVSKIGFNDGKIQLREDGKTRTGMILIRPGDLVVSGINAAKGAIAVYDENETNSIAATIHYGAYIPNKSKVDVKYLWWLLRSNTFRDLLNRFVPGGIKTELKAKRFLPIPVPLPALSEQQRIVARIEFLAAKIEEAYTLHLKSSKEVDTLINVKLRKLTSLLIEKYGSASIDELLIDAGYGSSEKCNIERDGNAIPVLRIPNVASERIALNNLKFTGFSKHNHEKLLLSDGDVLVVRTNGSLDLVGRSAVIQELPEPMIFASYLIRLRFDVKRIVPDFAQRMLRRLRVDGELINFARTTAGQYNVSLGRLKAARIPVPTLSEQRQIVTELDTLQLKVNALKPLQTQTATELDALLPSILDKAFEGEF